MLIELSSCFCVLLALDDPDNIELSLKAGEDACYGEMPVTKPGKLKQA